MKPFNIEDVFSSKGRVKVLRVLIEHKALNITEIVRRSTLSYSSVVKHLRFLSQIGLVRERRYGKIRIFFVNEDHDLIKALKKILVAENRSKPPSS
ncbi:MAG: ArsR family transcriptional regulator [Thermoprotei archaeon]|nr:MAG: ArsR family transcriptional regulator [Thermoprotei archaeon]RLF00673.1 MAG: ArsR family transcriptional regulator [Thermoprotei archaeon]